MHPLLEAVRNYLDITWEDNATDIKICGIISRGEAYLDQISGSKLDYTIEDMPRGLLFDYCRYARSNQLEDFSKNYMSELLTLQMREDVRRYADRADQL